MALTAAASPSSLPQSSTGRLEVSKARIVFSLRDRFHNGSFQANRCIADDWLGPETDTQHTSEGEIKEGQPSTQTDMVTYAADNEWHDRAAHNSSAQDAGE